MAIKLSAAYSKKAGLPGYSSHAFYVSVETELLRLEDVPKQSEQLYGILQQSVDRQIQQTGFVPPNGYGMEESQSENWNCSAKQRELIQKIVAEKNLDQGEVEKLANDMFGVLLPQLNKLQASGLIDEMLVRYGNGKTSYRKNGNVERKARA